MPEEQSTTIIRQTPYYDGDARAFVCPLCEMRMVLRGVQPSLGDEKGSVSYYECGCFTDDWLLTFSHTEAHWERVSCQ